MSQRKNNPVHFHSVAAHAVKSVATALVLVMSFATPSYAQSDVVKKQDPRISRAEVIADLALWRRAGVDRYEMSVSYSLETAQYRMAYQEYLRLRNSDQFQIEVQKALKE